MPKRVDHTARRARLADAAIAAIEARGLDAMRLVDVAKAADATTGTVMHYLPNKDAVLEAAFAALYRRVLDGLREGRGTPIVDRALAYLPHDAESARDWRIMLQFWGRAASDDRLKAIHRTAYDEQRAILVSEFETVFAPDEAALHADAAVAVVDGLGARIAMEPEVWPEARRRETVSLLFAPLLTRLAGLQDR